MVGSNCESPFKFISKSNFLKGLLISKAAHCVQSTPSGYSIQFGSTFISPNGSNVVGVEAVYPHEDYNPSNQYIHDIALVKVSTPIVNNIFNSKVKLPARGAFYLTGTPAVLAGWGRNGVKFWKISNF